MRNLIMMLFLALSSFALAGNTSEIDFWTQLQKKLETQSPKTRKKTLENEREKVRDRLQNQKTQDSLKTNWVDVETLVTLNRLLETPCPELEDSIKNSEKGSGTDGRLSLINQEALKISKLICP